MMDMTPKLAAGASLITGYSPQGFTIAGTLYTGSVIVLPTSVRPWPDAELTQASLSGALAGESAEILLIGTGKTHIFIPPASRASLKQHFGAGIESMDTGAACRTFNILLAEGRAVAAALIAQ